MYQQTIEKNGLLPTEVAQLDFVKGEMVDALADVVRAIAARKRIDDPQVMGQFLIGFFSDYFYEIGNGVSAEIFGMPNEPVTGE
jgi:hypothetical protein